MLDKNSDNLIDNETRIDRYMKGLMTIEEESAFVDDLKSDEQLRTQTESIAQLIKAMNVVGEGRDKVIISQLKEVKHTSHNRIYWAIAACILCFCILSIKGYDYMNVTSLGDNYCGTFPISDIIRGTQNQNTVEQLKELFSNIEEGKEIASSLAQLSILWQESQSEIYNDYTDYSPYIGWYLAVGYLKNYDKQSAKDILQKMKEQYPANTAIGEKVRELLNKI